MLLGRHRRGRRRGLGNRLSLGQCCLDLGLEVSCGLKVTGQAGKLRQELAGIVAQIATGIASRQVDGVPEQRFGVAIGHGSQVMRQFVTRGGLSRLQSNAKLLETAAGSLDNNRPISCERSRHIGKRQPRHGTRQQRLPLCGLQRGHGLTQIRCAAGLASRRHLFLQTTRADPTSEANQPSLDRKFRGTLASRCSRCHEGLGQRLLAGLGLAQTGATESANPCTVSRSSQANRCLPRTRRRVDGI